MHKGCYSSAPSGPFEIARTIFKPQQCIIRYMHCWGVRVVQQPESLAFTLSEGATAFTSRGEFRSHWQWSLSNCPPTRNNCNGSAARLCTRNHLKPGYKSLITPPLCDLTGIYALRPRALRVLARASSVYTCAISLEEVL